MDWVAVPLRVRYGETDQMGHAYYANYLLWFEVARGEWCRSRGFTYKSLEERGLFMPVVEVWARYRGEIHYDDDIVIRVRVPEVKRASIKFAYEIAKAGRPELLTEAFTWHVLMGPERRAVTIPDDIRQVLAPTP